MLTMREKRITAKELQENYAKLNSEKSQILKDLQFSEEQLEDALAVCKKRIASPSDIWKLRDYLEEKLTGQGKTVTSFSVLIPSRNHWYSYQKTW